jgi:ComF family protein
MIKAWKFDGSIINKNLFADCLLDAIRKNCARDDLPEGLIAVPISKKRCQERGFNQALQLCKQLSKHLKIKRYDGVLGCRFQQQHQASLSAEERKQHLRDTFYIRRTIKLPKHMAIIDDVMTTGSTLQTIAKLLLENGVEKIEFWGIAKVSKKTAIRNINKSA